MIGQLGDISFSVSSERVMTFDDLTRQGSARFASHSRQGGKELSEFLGPSLSAISMKIRLSAAAGVNPKEELTRLREIMNTGEAVLFVLDGEPQGDAYWNITALSEAHKIIDNEGRTISAEVSVSLKEYLDTRE